MNLIEELNIIIKSVREEKLDGLIYMERVESLKRHNIRFDKLVKECIKRCQLNQFVPFSEISSIVNAEITEVQSGFKFRPNPKLPNCYDTLLSWRKKLNYLKYEIEKRDYSQKDTICYCSLRITNRIEPDFTALSDYGRAVLYYEDDNYVIKQCNYCNTKWVNDDSPGSSRGWCKWNPNEFTIVKKFKTE